MKPWKACLPAAALVLGGCFATQSDIRVLQGDLGLVRSENATADSLRRIQLDHVIASLRALNDSMHIMTDSVTTLNNRMFRFRSDMSTSMTSIEQQLLQIQELTGQSQRRLQDLRASMESRQEGQQSSVAATPDSASAGGSATSDATPGPSQLFQAARSQLVQGSNASARSAFQDLLTKYPKSDLAPEAQLSIATTYEAEGNTDAADSTYAYTATTYPKSRSAATAIYKRAVLAQKNGKTDTARKLFHLVIKKYPNSDEASLAHDLLKTLGK
ncbi:MAG TPA: tetratricopeptide repeat protein, partial [Gemmatimonadaceae bacterium]|jgi:tol-pal system protein YbgF|nr:tetratricopeptide repeat protein [Gemmatimonadaceae bacterium]